MYLLGSYFLQEYQKQTNRQDLNFTIQVLTHMSALATNFMSFKPYLSAEDERLDENDEAIEFFRNWYHRSRKDTK